MASPVLLIDDDAALLGLLRLELEAEGHRIVTAVDGASALSLLESDKPGAVVLDLGLPDIPGEELLARIVRDHPELPVVILTARDDVGSVVDCMRAGASDFVTKPFDHARLVTAVANAIERGRLTRENSTLKRQLRQTRGFDRLLGTSRSVKDAVDLLRRAAQADVSVLIEGESGTGKEVAARALHIESSRGSGPFVALNCGAIPESLIESELFGHERGAFTGAAGQRKGRFEEAEGGTLFLDEIGELKPDAQVRLLRVLQERQIQRLGSNRDIDVNVRIVAATHCDLQKMVSAGRFREDLFYRLAVFPVRLPTLRERGDDVTLLATHFLLKFAKEMGREIEGFSLPTQHALVRHSWPGNVRELLNVVQRATILCDTSKVRLRHLPAEFVAAAFPDGPPRDEEVSTEASAAPGEHQPDAPTLSGLSQSGTPPAFGPGIIPFATLERQALLHALEQSHWNVTAAATALGIGRATLYRKIERFGFSQTGQRSSN